MSSETDLAIRATNLGKAYQIFARPEDRLKQLIFGKRRKYYREFWALKNINLEVSRGHTVGIVGRNGSGKSTLLQMICGTLTPTEGELTVNGRIAALLELGAGFNPEFNGRENVFLNAQILGLQRAEIEARFDRIAAFADIGTYIDQPVKTYSTGMYARLAFAVAIHVDPEILVVDEALSVGDEAFQRKCFSRIQQIREAGATVLFVSHSAGNIIELCDQAVLLDQGQELLTGKPKLIVAKYQKLAYAASEKVPAIREEIRRLHETQESDAANSLFTKPTLPEPTHAYDPFLAPQSTVSYDSRGAVVSDARITDVAGRQCNVLVHGDTYYYKYTVTFEKTAVQVRFGMMLKTVTGLELAGCASHPDGSGVEIIEKGQRLAVQFRFQNLLAPGTYFLNAGVLGRCDGDIQWLHRVLDVLMFRVQPVSEQTFTGMVNIMSADACQFVEVEDQQDAHV